MPNDGKHRFTPTEDLLAKRIGKQYKKEGVPKKKAKAIGYATVQKINNDPKYRSKVTNQLRNR